MIKAGIVGFGGRMGSLIARLILESPDLALSGALEDKAHSTIGKDVGLPADAEVPGPAGMQGSNLGSHGCYAPVLRQTIERLGAE